MSRAEEDTSKGGPLSEQDRRHLETLFERAADLPPEERAAFVRRECGPSDPLRSKLEQLLAGLKSEDVLGRLQPGTPLQAGTRIGPYKLLEKIGEGGMGEVYAAEQLGPISRRVALKVVKLGMDSGQVVARFEAERQALARMSHPNIAQVFDGGAAADGRPYFVMEHVAGDPLTAYCDRRKLPTRRRLELFIAVCEGVQHAHQKGIIHRDLKPSNLLVLEQDGRAVPKIIDFGIARATTGSLAERTLHTMVGQIIGTLDYMSPEQADPTALDVDTRSDIYSLGVVLYKLVSGLLPFEHLTSGGHALSEVQRVIREQDPQTPSARLRRQTGTATTIAPLHGTDERSLVRQLSGDLDWITLKALEKDPSRRYASASELADDVRRHLANQPVLAGRPGALYRARKFVRRHRVAVTAGVLVAAAAVVGVVGVVSGRARASAAALLTDALKPYKDSYVLAELVSRADSDLWPPHPAKIPELDAWMREAQDLADRLEKHQADLAKMRAAGLESDEDRSRFESLAALVQDLDSLTGPTGLLSTEPGAVSPGHGWSVPRRIDFALELEAGFAEGGAYATAWRQQLAEIREAYPGLELTAQMGLVPIGRDDFSGLWEFWHVASGAEPVRGADGRLVLGADTGIVLVLIPAGTFSMGAQHEDPGGPNYDPYSRPRPNDVQYEFPVHEVRVDAFFLSKYELTQGQWLRLQGTRPSMVTVIDNQGRPLGDRPMYLPEEPVNQVSASDCTQATTRFGLALPHEEQWEYAARADMATIWPTPGGEPPLPDEANLFVEMPFGKAVEVEQLSPNAWGLHGVIGNVTEWCANPPYDYATGATAEPSLRAARGGNFRTLATEKARSASRMNQNVLFHHPALGLRPARAIEGAP